jgi:hypothetical protein
VEAIAERSAAGIRGTQALSSSRVEARVRIVDVGLGVRGGGEACRCFPFPFLPERPVRGDGVVGAGSEGPSK